MNKELIEKLAKDKFGSVRKLASAMDIPTTSMQNKLIGKSKFTKAELIALCSLLDVTEDEIKEIPKSSSTETVPSASSIIQTEEIKAEIKALDDEIRALRNDLSTMAKMLIEINKTTHETSAQANLNADELTSIFSKVGEINGNVTKIYARYKKG